MNKNALWKTFVARNPSFEGYLPITMSPKGLRKMFDTIWDQAEKTGFENGIQSVKATKDVAKAAGAKDNNFEDIFGQMFGNKSNNPFGK